MLCYCVFLSCLISLPFFKSDTSRLLQVRDFVRQGAALADFSASYAPAMDLLVREIFSSNDGNGDGMLARSEWRAPDSFLPGGSTQKPDKLTNTLRNNIKLAQDSKREHSKVTSSHSDKDEL